VREIDRAHFENAMWEAKRHLSATLDMTQVLMAAGDLTPDEREAFGEFRVKLDRAQEATRDAWLELAVVASKVRQITQGDMT